MPRCFAHFTLASPHPIVSPVSPEARGATPRKRASLPAISLTAQLGKMGGAQGRSHRTLAKLAEGMTIGEEIGISPLLDHLSVQCISNVF